MSKINYDSIIKEIFLQIGGDKNISTFTNCQTRLRINVKNLDIIDKVKLNKIDGVLGVNITGTQVQLIFGPGKVVKAAAAFAKISKKNKVDNSDESLEEIAKKNKDNQKQNNTSALQRFLGKFSGIFAPLILGFIGAGILQGIGSIIESSTGDTKSDTVKSWIAFFTVLLSIWKGTFLVIVGWRTSEAFGGSGVMGAIIAGLYVAGYSGAVDKIFVPGRNNHFNFLGIDIENAKDNWLTVGLRPATNQFKDTLSYPSGSIFGVMFSAGIVGRIETLFRKFIPSHIDTVATPTLTLLVLLIVNFTLIIPISGYVFLAVSFIFQNLYGNPFGAAFLSGIFLITVVFGIHQGFVPVYQALIADTGVNGLFPILAMAGAGQVGMALALWLRANKKGKLRSQIQGAILPGFLGIGEPLIYGVSLPRVKPFITAMIGGAVGGFLIGAFNLWGPEPIGLNTTFGPSGLLATPLMTTPGGSIVTGVMVYLLGLLSSYAGGFLTTYYFGHKNVDLK